MELETPHRSLHSLTDDEIESCIQGSSNVELIRKLLKLNQAPDGWIWSMDFGHAFAETIEAFIDADPGTDEWDQAWQINCDWGEKIADNVNELLSMPNE